MFHLSFLIICALFASLWQVPSSKKFSGARGWRGIVPLHSTREDVHRLLGPSTGDSSIYKLKDVVVSIDYADGLPCEKCWSYGWNVPAGTVTTITVRPTGKLDLADSGLDLSTYKIVKDPEVKSVEYYTNEKEGIFVTYVPSEHSIASIMYGPSEEDKSLDCSTRRNSPAKTDSPSHTQRFDYYGDKVFSEEKEHLNYFASRLQEPGIDIGYIVVYAGQLARVCEANLRATQAKNYLVNQRGIKPEKILVINGGYREKFIVELYAGSATWNQPIVTPTIRPSKVQIIRDNKATARLRKSLKLTRDQCEQCFN